MCVWADCRINSERYCGCFVSAVPLAGRAWHIAYSFGVFLLLLLLFGVMHGVRRHGTSGSFLGTPGMHDHSPSNVYVHTIRYCSDVTDSRCHGHVANGRDLFIPKE